MVDFYVFLVGICTVDGSDIWRENQLRLVVYPTIFVQKASKVLGRISEPSTVWLSKVQTMSIPCTLVMKNISILGKPRTPLPLMNTDLSICKSDCPADSATHILITILPSV